MYSRFAVNRLRYRVATSLDGYIAGPSGENDWMMMDSAFDFGKFLGEFDTVLLGRRTYQEAARHRGDRAGDVVRRLLTHAHAEGPSRDDDRVR